MKRIILPLAVLSFIILGGSCHPVKEKTPSITDTLTIITNQTGSGVTVDLHFTKGTEHNHPLMAVWIEDTNHHYLQTLYVSRSIATGIYPKKITDAGAWAPGEQRRPAALPVWSHAYGYVSTDGLFLPDPAHPVPDAYTGATPQGDFELRAKTEKGTPKIVDLYFEINQSWDWNETWHNSAFPGDNEYATSAQPSLVYHARIALLSGTGPYWLEPNGHGHPSGKDGKTYSDLSTFTTALQIAKKITVVIK